MIHFYLLRGLKTSGCVNIGLEVGIKEVIMTGKNTKLEQQGSYVPGYSSELVQLFQGRSATQEAGFFIPHICDGISLLDCGCGPGTITIGLAKINRSGQVVGIDIEESQIEIAKNYAKEQQVYNAQFKVGNVYALPFADNAFDAVFAHALLQHLRNPLEALIELKRVLKPDGVIGLRDDDVGGLILSPYSPQMEKVIGLLTQFKRYKGSDPFIGRRHRELLRKAGFTKVEASATCEYDGNLYNTRKRASLAAKLIQQMTEKATSLGWADADEMRKLSDAAKEWGENEDAFDVIICCEAIGYKAKII